MDMSHLSWRDMTPNDLVLVDLLANRVHTGLPERLEVFAEKLYLFGAGCRVLQGGNTILGYGIGHPWVLNGVPALDSWLGALPAAADCLYVHDVVIDAVASGHGAAGWYIDYMCKLATSLRIGHLALVSVYGTHVVWRRYGFIVSETPNTHCLLSSYGHTAKYMTRAL